jgi:hypothetical protein
MSIFSKLIYAMASQNTKNETLEAHYENKPPKHQKKTLNVLHVELGSNTNLPHVRN